MNVVAAAAYGGVEGGVVEHAVTRQRFSFQPATGHEDFSGRGVDGFRGFQERKAGHHCGAHAGAAHDVEHYAAFLKRLEDSDMGRPEAAAAARHISDRLANEEAMKACKVDVILDRNMVVHIHRPACQPCRRPGRGALAMFVNDNKAPMGEPMSAEGQFFHGIECGDGRSGNGDDDLVGLADRLLCPGGQAVVGDIDDEIVIVLDRVQPIRDDRKVGGLPGKLCGNGPLLQNQCAAAAAEDASEPVDKVRHSAGASTP